MKETAYAKINLALHVRRRREDGYHELETLFAFVDQGDTLSVRPEGQSQVTTVGEFAGGIDDPLDNLVAKALNALPHPQGLGITLEKNLPVAAGLGGGSADAGAVFRIVERLHGLPDDWQTRAARLGADVPSCVRSEMAIGRGTGTDLEPVENDLAGWPVLLVNPRIPLPTGPVFKAWWEDWRVDEGPLPEGSARNIALFGRNSLERPAEGIVTEISDVLEQLQATDPVVSRMSGSGATCFALYPDEATRDAAHGRIREKRPHWWQLAGKLR
ncbi:MAG: 4-(cytidine 5'-diphospho)-2-C-methyl-D-erythritol kinase [Erythrobacter sp.]|jgi:4-diphosphocytidyl-2-C-methyl-D-erythritol kinase|nr:4-(cytidine 5'-diphospho)-2-C-methyl-D-erythritol kinase [Erythrobacter sp.]